jgi:nucleoside-triphosphatase
MGESVKIGITGLPSAGKTSALMRVVEMLREEGMTVGGMITESLVEDNVRMGFYITDISKGTKGVLAHKDLDSRVKVGEYGVDMEVLEEVGVQALRDATESADVIVVDEVGKMEVESEDFIEAVKTAMEADKPLILTLHKKSRNPLLQDIRRRDDVRILEVTPVNRNLLPYKILKLLKGETW